MPPSPLRWLERKVIYSVGFGVAALLLVGAGLFYYRALSLQKPRVVRVGYASGGLVRKYFLEQLAAHGKARRLDIRVVETESTAQTLSLIDQDGLDLGVIPGAIEDRADRNILEIAPLYMEPLQLVVRGTIYDAVVKDFGQLRGRSIGLDSENSATSLVGTELLRFIGLTDPASGLAQYRPIYVAQSQLGNVPHDSLPDAIFQIGGVPSPTIRALISNHGYRLVPLPFGGSFSLNSFREADTPHPPDNTRLRLDKTFIEEATIPAFTYGVLPAVPAEDTRTIATRLVLIGSARLDDATVHDVLELILSPEISSMVRPALTADLLHSSFQFDRHPGTDHYLNAQKPFDVDGTLSAYLQVAELWGVIIALYFAGAKGWKAWRERRSGDNAKSAEDFMREILAIEARVQQSASNDERVTLDQALTDLKKEFLELHLDGRLDDEEAVPALLATLADARERVWQRRS